MDWVVSALAFIGIWQIGRKARWGWLASAASYFLWAVMSYPAQLYGFVIAGMVLGLMALRSWWAWRPTVSKRYAALRRATKAVR